jgi:hypothetical protein
MSIITGVLVIWQPTAKNANSAQLLIYIFALIGGRFNDGRFQCSQTASGFFQGIFPKRFHP